MTTKDINQWLKTQDKNVLVKIIIEQAENNERLLRQLSLKAAKSRSSNIDVKTYREAIEDAVYIEDFISYREAYNYATGIDDVIDSIEELLDDNHACEVAELVDYALKAVEEAINRVDDSSGIVGGLLSRLQDIHFEACKQAEIDPEELAAYLFEWELRSGFDTFYGAMKTYANILGEKGLAKYRELAENEWNKVSVLNPGDDTKEKYGRRFRITSIMESIARETGDVEDVIAVKKRDLSSAWNYFQIAQTYKEAGKNEQALQWAEKGVEAFPDRTDSRLRAILIEEYLERKRHDEAMTIAWQEFTESPTLSQYRNLEGYASQIDQWALWRTKALDFIRNTIDQKNPQKRRPYSWSSNLGNSVLVQVFLWENDIEAAWKEALEGGCTDSLWMELANKRKETHSKEVIPIYQKALETTVKKKNNDAYKEAVELLKVIETLMNSLEKRGEFVHYLDSIRVAHKPKRNLMKMLRSIWP